METKNTKKQKKNRLRKVLIFFGILFCGLQVWTVSAEHWEHYVPGYPKVSLTEVLKKQKKQELTAGDYQLLLLQTGLGKPAVDEFWVCGQKERETEILAYQKDFFRPVLIEKKETNPLIRAERIGAGNGQKGESFVKLQEGDILITPCSRFLGWRNGHAALVVDAEEGKILESISLGVNSKVRSWKAWESYPAFLVLRLSEACGGSEEKRSCTGKEIAKYAMENGRDVPYRLSAGILIGRKSAIEKQTKEVAKALSGTQCAHLIWSCYRAFGYDLDGDGGMLVTPKDISRSSQLEVVQIYGVNPTKKW